jgi:hypothetical protein
MGFSRTLLTNIPATKGHEKPETRAVMVDITDDVVLKTGYGASIKVHQGRELIMYMKPEKREMMIKTNPDGKHDEVNTVRERDNVRQGRQNSS